MAFEYIVNGKVVELPVNPDKIAVRFRQSLPSPQRKSVIDEKKEVGDFERRLEVPNETLTIVDVTPSDQPGPKRTANAASALNADPAVEQVLPVFDLGTRQAVATDRIIVGFNTSNPEKAEEIIRSEGGEIVRSDKSTGEYVVKLGAATNPFDVVSSLMKRADVAFAEPDFVTIGTHTPRRTTAVSPEHGPNGNGEGNGHGDGLSDIGSTSSLGKVLLSDPGLSSFSDIAVAAAGTDPLLQSQYAVRLTQADLAWNLVTGSPDITIAILDEGVDINHADLAAAITETYDAIDQDDDQQPNPWDGHGTACAGLAAAIGNNSVGVRGIASGCSLMGIRIAYSAYSGAGWTTTNSQISDAIDWAWKNGADILSNSWGGGAPSNAIINAFERARTLGRNGLGCVVVIAAGNDSLPLSFPANLPNVLTVTASNEYDEPKTKTSADGETWWGSSFGAEADVAAPGVHNYTTDISGSDGYNPGGALDGDYVSNFNGTSSATPIAAGVAGLVLSANPNLPESSVRRILKDSADKVGQVVYVNGRNNQMGHGRVNALKAVEMAPTSI